MKWSSKSSSIWAFESSNLGCEPTIKSVLKLIKGIFKKIIEKLDK